MVCASASLCMNSSPACQAQHRLDWLQQHFAKSVGCMHDRRINPSDSTIMHHGARYEIMQSVSSLLSANQKPTCHVGTIWNLGVMWAYWYQVHSRSSRNMKCLPQYSGITTTLHCERSSGELKALLKPSLLLLLTRSKLLAWLQTWQRQHRPACQPTIRTLPVSQPLSSCLERAAQTAPIPASSCNRSCSAVKASRVASASMQWRTSCWHWSSHGLSLLAALSCECACIKQSLWHLIE